MFFSCLAGASAGREARTLLSAAEAYKQQRIAEAVGGANRFLSLQKEQREGARHRQDQAYLEAVEKILPRVRLYVVDSDKGRVPLHLRMSGP
jgi:membrane protease subunit HflK